MQGTIHKRYLFSCVVPPPPSISGAPCIRLHNPKSRRERATAVAASLLFFPSSKPNEEPKPASRRVTCFWLIGAMSHATQIAEIDNFPAIREQSNSFSQAKEPRSPSARLHLRLPGWGTYAEHLRHVARLNLHQLQNLGGKKKRRPPSTPPQHNKTLTPPPPKKVPLPDKKCKTCNLQRHREAMSRSQSEEHTIQYFGGKRVYICM